jgi:hypothetical protein
VLAIIAAGDPIDLGGHQLRVGAYGQDAASRSS